MRACWSWANPAAWTTARTGSARALGRPGRSRAAGSWAARAVLPGLARDVTYDDLPEAAAEEARASGSWAKVIGDTSIRAPA